MSILKAGRNQSLDRMTKQVLAVVSEQFFCLRIDEDDFPSFIDDDHRVWRRLEQLTEGEDLGLHSKLMAHTLTSLLELVADGCLGGCSDIAPFEVRTRDTISRMF
jgi:hypothetical protein